MLSFLRLFRQSPVLFHRGNSAATGVAQPRSRRGRPRKVETALQSPNSLRDEIQRIQTTSKFSSGLGPAYSVNVVSEQLCDETLEFLAPSLEPYKGCEILDLFPGVGLWSRKIHELIRPRKHTFIDVHEDSFEPFLHPFVKQPGSTFELKSVEAARKGNRRREAYRDLSSYLHKTADEEQKPLLILAGLTRLPVLRPGPDGELYWGKRVVRIDENIPVNLSQAESFFYDFIQQITGPNTSAIRPFRLLTWMLDRDKLNLLPRTIGGRKSTASEVNEVFEIEEIVGSSEGARGGKYLLPSKFELRNAIAVAERMKTNGIAIPAGRLARVHKEIVRQMDERQQVHRGATSYSIELTRELDELDELETRYALDEPSMVRYAEKKERGGQRNESELRLRMDELRAKFDELVGIARHQASGNLFSLESVHEALLVDLERSIVLNKPTSPFITASPGAPGGFIVHLTPLPSSSSSDIRIDLPTLTTLVHKDHRRNIQPNKLSSAAAFIDNYHALFRSRPLLTWNNRRFEPLQPRPDEFQPNHNLALLSLTPRQPAPPVPHAPPNITLSRLPPFRHLRSLETKPLPAALNRLAHGCADALLPHCPSLTDPAKGGRRDVRLLRVRMVTEEMWREIMTAWYQWPFRRSDEEMESDLGHSSIFKDFDAGN